MKKIKKTSNSLETQVEHITPSVTVIGDSSDTADVATNETQPQVQKFGYFATPIYHIQQANFLPQLQTISQQMLSDHEQKFPELHPIYPVRQSESALSEENMGEFFEFVGYTSWNALQSEGYDMKHFSVQFQEAWFQQHNKHSGHDEHVHAYGSQMVGFYFLETPKNSGRLVFHDPRPAKRQITLPEANISVATEASTAINFEPKAGDLFLAPSWVPHSISRHGGDTPMVLLHMTLTVTPATQEQIAANTATQNVTVI